MNYTFSPNRMYINIDSNPVMIQKEQEPHIISAVIIQASSSSLGGKQCQEPRTKATRPGIISTLPQCPQWQLIVRLISTARFKRRGARIPEAWSGHLHFSLNEVLSEHGLFWPLG
jgi:hypothetical protein